MTSFSKKKPKPTKLRCLSKHKTFFGLLKKFYNTQIIHQSTPKPIIKRQITPTTLPFELFNKYYVPLLTIIYVGVYTKYWLFTTLDTFNPVVCNHLHYYAKKARLDKQLYPAHLPRIFFQTYTINHFLVFSKPKKQLFMLIFKTKPTFIFTCGLMRFIMNEKKKSTKKLYKVAVSLIKLSTILISKKDYFISGYLKLINLGSLRFKILKEIYKTQASRKIHYVILTVTRSYAAQKFKTRRSIK
jgi:hypothetical protein